MEERDTHKIVNILLNSVEDDIEKKEGGGDGGVKGGANQNNWDI